MLKKHYFLVIFLLSLNCLYSAATADTDQIVKGIKAQKDLHPDSNIVFSFPVNVYNDKVNMTVNIPNTYKVLENPPGSDLLEFIPSSDKDPYAWSEIITVVPYIGKKLKAQQI